MNKIWLIMIMILMCSTQVLSTECDVSEDNITFTDITSPLYGGYVDDNQGLAYIQNMQAETTYYARCRENSTATWQYMSIDTKDEWSEAKMLAIILGLFITMVFFIAMSFFINAAGTKILFRGIALVELVNISFFMYLNEIGGNLGDLLKLNFYIMLTIAFGVGMVSLILFTMKLINPASDINDEKPKKWS